LTSSFRIAGFLNSDQSRCASKLLSAYEEGDIEEIKRVAQLSPISHLDHMVSLLYQFSIQSPPLSSLFNMKATHGYRIQLHYGSFTV